MRKTFTHLSHVVHLWVDFTVRRMQFSHAMLSIKINERIVIPH